MLKLLDHLEEWLVATLIGAATVIIFLSVVHRYVSGLPIPLVQDWLLSLNMSWTQELCIYMFIWMAKFGAAYGVRTGIHVGVDVFINSLNSKLRAKFVVIGLSGGALFTAIIGSLGTAFVWEVGLRYAVASTFGFDWHDLTEGPVSPDLEWPVWIFYSAIPLGSYLMCFRFLQVITSFIRTGQLPRHDDSHVDGLDDVIGDYNASSSGKKSKTGGNDANSGKNTNDANIGSNSHLKSAQKSAQNGGKP